MPSPSSYADWLARGRAHQREGRLIDAMPCFERASTLEARASDAHFHLGEVCWQLGLAAEAVRAWREAARRAPGHLAPKVALSEALLFVGDDAGAHAAASDALAIAADDHRARTILAVSRPLADAPAIDLRAITALAAQETVPFASVAIASALARRWNRDPSADGASSLALTLAPCIAWLPWPLLVPLAGEAFASGVQLHCDAIVRAALEREVASQEIDALREIARLAHEGGQAQAAAALAGRYAELCAQSFVPAHPLTWPRRTSGERLRVAVLAPAHDLQSATMVLEALRLRGDACESVVWVLADETGSDAKALEAPASVEIRRWASSPDLQFARAIAAEDPDVLIDAIGMEGPVGPVAALRPARAVLSFARIPLAEALLCVPFDTPASVRELSDRLIQLHRHALDSPACLATAGELRRIGEEAVRLHQSGERQAAVDAYGSLLALQPGFAPGHFLRGVLHREIGSEALAAQDFAQALAVAPGYVEARVAAIRLASSARRQDEVDRLAGEGQAHTGHADPVLLRTLGEAKLASGDTEQAIECLRHALSLAPIDPDTHYNLGVAAQMRGNTGEAARAYQRALVLSPDHVAAHFNMGVLFQQQGNHAGARTAYGNVIARDPVRASAYKNLGEALLAAGDLDGFLSNFSRFEAACPDSLSLAVQALEACPYRGDFAGLERYLEGLRSERFKAADAAELVDCLEQLLYLLLFFDVEPELMHRLARTYASSAARVYGEPLTAPAERVPGPLRVGYLSADLRNHVMGKMMWQALQHHDRERFVLHFYSTSAVRDAWTGRFEGIAHRFVDVSSGSEREAALRIAADDLDLLVDLSSHTKGGKPGILAFKPARVQITHVASAGPVGLTTIDYKLTDQYADVPESEAHQIEPLLAMEGCVYPYRHVAPAATHAFHRSAFGIAAHEIVIGAFVSPLKLSRRCLTLWQQVLAGAPAAKLAFSPVHPGLRTVFLRLVAAAGIDASRIVFLPQGRDDAENQARYGLVDFVLDPMPFGGVNGVLEPLDMGVPVVTLMGRRHGERSAYTILVNLDVTGTIATTGGEYVAIAIRLAQDPAFARAMRDSIRKGLAGSPLVDMPAHTRNLEAAYLEALRRNAPQALAAESCQEAR